MAQYTDRDGKSKTASAVDGERYPEQNEVDDEAVWVLDHADIADRANQLWRARGCPEGSALRDWFDAQEELRASRNSQKTRKVENGTGSVQS